MSRDCVLAVTVGPTPDKHADRWKQLVVRMLITFVHEPVSVLQDNGDVSWVLFHWLRSGCMPTDTRSGVADHPVAQREW